MITAVKNLSPFDVNMAYDAGWTACTPYLDVTLGEVEALVQDAIFSRGPKGVRRTGIFLGGRDIHLAMDMLEAARKAMVPPFEVSVFADPSGAFTTAAALVARAERQLRETGGEALAGRRVLVIGGTGPVGSTAAMLAAMAGAEAVVVSHHSLERAQSAARECGQRYGVEVSAADGSDDAKLHALLADAEVVFNAAKAGVRVLGSGHIRAAGRLRVAGDLNAVPPEGIEGVGVMDDGVPLEGSPSGAVGIGALAVGNVKYRVQQELLQQMHAADSPRYLGFREAFEAARRHVG
jgi:methylene-tetrahydromethanopterin dehydrogenase